MLTSFVIGAANVFAAWCAHAEGRRLLFWANIGFAVLMWTLAFREAMS